MVTPEEKLALFYKLLRKEREDENARERDKLEQTYKEKLIQEKQKIDEKTRKIIENLEKESKEKKLAQEGYRKSSIRKQILLVEEQCSNRLLKKMINRCEAFTETDQYLVYLEHILVKLASGKKEEPIIISVTPNDYKKYSAWILSWLDDNGFSTNQVTLAEGAQQMLGGMRVVYLSRQVRMDFSMKGILEANKERLRESMHGAIGKEYKS